MKNKPDVEIMVAEVVEKTFAEMMNQDLFPRLEIHLDAINHNAQHLHQFCSASGIKIAGVVKCCGSDLMIAEAIYRSGCVQLASSRIEQLAKLRDVFPEAQLLMLRIPMHSELRQVILFSDISLQSEESTLVLLNKIAGEMKREHGVILMYDVGDLREGFYKEEELLRMAKLVEEMDYVQLKGIGTSFACFGSILPGKENLLKLSNAAEKVEELIGRPLEYISGGSSISLMALAEQNFHPKVNHLRLGDHLLNPRGMHLRRGFFVPGINENTFILTAEVIEIKMKPSVPEGKISLNWRGEKPRFEDRGTIKRAIIALGSQDIYDSSTLIPCLEGVEIIGSSSDHMVLDITSCKEDINVGDKIHFYPLYEHLLSAFHCPSVHKVYI